MPRTTCSMLLAALLAGLVAGSAGADTIYKVRLKDGSIAFTDRPPPGSMILDKREAQPPPAVLPAVTPKPDRASTDGRVPVPDSERKEAAVAAAERALAKAKEDLEQGRNPREGDFIGTARKGFVRPSPAFEERVRALEQAVADAQARLAKAIEARDAAR